MSPHQLKDWIKQAQQRLQDLEARMDRQIAYEERDRDAPRDHLILPVQDCLAPLLLIRKQVQR